MFTNQGLHEKEFSVRALTFIFFFFPEENKVKTNIMRELKEDQMHNWKLFPASVQPLTTFGSGQGYLKVLIQIRNSFLF